MVVSFHHALLMMPEVEELLNWFSVDFIVYFEQISEGGTHDVSTVIGFAAIVNHASFSRSCF